MTYAANSDLPADVRGRFSDACQTVWREAWNDAFKLHSDEGRAFATAEIAGQNCKSAGKSAQTALKFVGPNTIEGLAIPFGGFRADGTDWDHERFSPQTDLCIEWFGKSGRPVLYHHGLHDAMKASVIGRQTDFETREEGIFAQSELDKNARYRKAIDGLIEREALGYSSGAMPHLATKSADGKTITRWPWVELSLTPIPSAGTLSSVHYVKSADVFEHFEEAGAEMPLAAMKALAAWADTRDDPLPAGEPFAEHADRLLVDVEAFRDRLTEVRDLRVKAGRVLSAATRERLAAHPAALEQVASDMRDLLDTADAGKSALIAEMLEFEATQARLLGVEVPALT
jgi:cation transport regulator ChaB